MKSCSKTTIDIPRITVSAPHRSSGKSTVATGLSAALSAKGLKVQPFKKGPDFIDPMWYEAASGRKSRNLDIFIMGKEKVLESFARHSGGADISIIEGNMGLYDGQDPEGSDSTAGLARLIKSPVVLVVDCHGMTRGIAPLVRGFEDFEPETTILGVILNNVRGSRHEKKLRDAVERYCTAEVIGAIPHCGEAGIAMRHLGLIPLKEDPALLPTIEALRKVVADNVNLSKILSIARAAEPLPDMDLKEPERAAAEVKIGVAADNAFTFYYPDNLEALEAAGAELVYFSPMKDTVLPDVDGIYIGGGFPEVHMAALEKNIGMRRAIKESAMGGMPVYAECGGLMYLCRSISWQGKTFEMTGVFPYDIVMSERPAGHGYLVLKPSGIGAWPPFGEEIRAHEFHHSSIGNLGQAEYAYRVVRGRGVDGDHDGMTIFNTLASYAHIHALGTPDWARTFVGFVKKHSRKR
ncbi:MAG: cobyrinate a,c-diamide synthase [Nitrospirota bacterium]